MKRFLLSCLVIVLAQVALAQDATPSATPDTTTQAVAVRTPAEICASEVPAQNPATHTFSQPDQVLQPGVDYRAVFCTDVGPVYIDLFEKFAPQTVNSFVFLAQHDYFNNTTFHRVIQGEIAQGGDPTGTGTGDPGYSIPDEFVGFLNFNTPGWLAMANAGPNTNGSQFFITTAPTPSLNYHYTIFGQVLEGQDNVAKIRSRDPSADTQPGTGLSTVVIITDPSTVKTTYLPPAPPTRGDLSAALDSVDNALPATLVLDTNLSGVFESAQVAQFAPDAMRTDFAAFLDKYHFDYRVGHRVTNRQCDLQTIPYMAISFNLDHFATPADAHAALTDGFLQQMAQVNGYSGTQVSGLEYPLYTQSRQVCDMGAIDAMTFWQRGHFVISASVLFPSSSQATAATWLTEVDLTYEGIFSDSLLAEMQ